MSIIENMHEGVSTRVRRSYRETKDLSVRIGVHQVLALSDPLFSSIMDEITIDIKDYVH